MSSQERLLQVLRAPVVSEKSTLVGDTRNQVVFEATRDASKAEIKKAVQTLFNVKVIGVTTLNVKGKTKAFRGRSGRKPGWKKAYVSLAPGEELDLLGGVE